MLFSQLFPAAVLNKDLRGGPDFFLNRLLTLRHIKHVDSVSRVISVSTKAGLGFEFRQKALAFKFLTSS